VKVKLTGNGMRRTTVGTERSLLSLYSVLIVSCSGSEMRARSKENYQLLFSIINIGISDIVEIEMCDVILTFELYVNF
jgi:hypothetical protein